MRDIGSFLALLNHVKTAGKDHWMADCPCQSHKTPGGHLSISLSDDKILLKCFGTDSSEDIVHSLKLELSDLFLKRETATIPSKVVATYDYNNEEGNLLFQVVRYEPKDFRPRHKNGKDEWVIGLEGVRRVLYRLQDVILSDEIYIVEGEKDVESLLSWGKIATTSPGGAWAWQPEYADYLKNKKVIIIPDKDVAGYNYAKEIVKSLEGKAKDIKVIILPGKAKDISEWLEQVENIETLDSLKLDQPSILNTISGENGENGENGEIVKRVKDGENSPLSGENSPYEKINQQVTEWLDFHQGETFDLDTICRQLDIKTAQGRKYVSTSLSKKLHQFSLEKTGRIYKSIRTYINNREDWVDAKGSSVIPLTWPFGREDDSHFGFDGHIQIMPHDVIVVAGVTNTGKTAFANEFVLANLDIGMPTRLQVIEYTPSKFHERIFRMNWAKPIDNKGKPRFEVIERHEDWQYAILPDGINVIDWINLSGEFYKIGKVIENIQSRLTTGIVMVLLQKKADSKLGYGQEWGEHLSSLYLTMDFGRIHVTKAKAWINHNPNNEDYGFDLVEAGTLFCRIRPIKKCGKCWGTGHTKSGECDNCLGSGWIDKS